MADAGSVAGDRRQAAIVVVGEVGLRAMVYVAPRNGSLLGAGQFAQGIVLVDRPLAQRVVDLVEIAVGIVSIGESARGVKLAKEGIGT